MLNNKIILGITILTWLVVVWFYMSHVSIDHCGNDSWQHVGYTETIVKEHRLPAPLEGWQTYHPPLYYLINSFIASNSLYSNKIFHINCVRSISVLYGVIALFIILWFISKINQPPLVKLLVSLFIATTPTFVFLFTTYNNDVLAILLSIIMFALSYESYYNWSRSKGIGLLLISTAGLYTKFTFVFSIISIVLICSKNLLQLKSPSVPQLRIVYILIFSVVLLFPWLYYHNYHYTKKLFPTNVEQHSEKLTIENIKPFIKVILPTAILDNFSVKWFTPATHPFGGIATKKYDYWSYIFINSITQGSTFQSPSIVILWLMLFTHLLAYLIGMTQMFKTQLTKFASFAILIGYVASISIFVYAHAQYSFSDYHSANPWIGYRYICWGWLGWAILYANAFVKSHNKVLPYIFSRVLLTGILAQIYFLVTISACGV